MSRMDKLLNICCTTFEGMLGKLASDRIPEPCPHLLVRDIASDSVYSGQSSIQSIYTDVAGSPRQSCIKHYDKCGMHIVNRVKNKEIHGVPKWHFGHSRIICWLPQSGSQRGFY